MITVFFLSSLLNALLCLNTYRLQTKKTSFGVRYCHCFLQCASIQTSLAAQPVLKASKCTPNTETGTKQFKFTQVKGSVVICCVQQKFQISLFPYPNLQQLLI